MTKQTQANTQTEVTYDDGIDAQSIGKLLDRLYADAEKRDDSNTMTIIDDVWGRVQRLDDTAYRMADAVGALKETALAVERQRDEALQAYMEIVTALQNTDDSHPIVHAFAQSIWTLFQSTYADGQDEELLTRIASTWDVDLDQASQMMNIMRGNHQPTSEQVTLIRSLMTNQSED